MNLTNWIQLPPVPQTDDPALNNYLRDLDRAIREALTAVYRDLSQGEATLTTFTAAPDATDLAENQLALRTDAGNEAIYTNVDGTIKSVALS